MSPDRELQSRGFLKRTVFHNLFIYFFICWHLPFWEKKKGRNFPPEILYKASRQGGHINALVSPQAKVKNPSLALTSLA